DEKGVRWLLDVYQHMSMPLRLVIAGDGPLREDVKRAVSRSNVEYRGYVTGDEKATLLRRATALLMPSECYENFPLAIVEANAAGIPVLASDLGGLQDMVLSGINGERFELKNAQALKTALDKILHAKDPGELRKRCKDYARANYSREHFLEKRLSIYRSLDSS